MTSLIASVSLSLSARHLLSQQGQALSGLLGPNSVVTSSSRKFPSLYSQPRRLQISCPAKPGTVDKVCEIVKKQLALAEDQVVTGESTFAALGADSLDTVEIVMGIEEAFGISVEEQNAQKIATIQDAADMVEDLVTCNA